MGKGILSYLAATQLGTVCMLHVHSQSHTHNFFLAKKKKSVLSVFCDISIVEGRRHLINDAVYMYFKTKQVAEN